MSYKKQKLLNFCDYLGSSPDVYEVRIAHSFSFLRCVFCFVCLCSVFRVACFPYLWIVNSWLSHHFSITFILLNVLFLNPIMLKIFLLSIFLWIESLDLNTSISINNVVDVTLYITFQHGHWGANNLIYTYCHQYASENNNIAHTKKKTQWFPKDIWNINRQLSNY